MFSCLNYGDHNRVVPIPVPGNTPPHSELPIPPLNSIKYDTLTKTAIIRIEGMGTNTLSICKQKKKSEKENVFFENVSYASRGITTDAKHLLRHSSSFTENGFDYSKEGRRSQRRLFELIKTIKNRLVDTTIETVIVIGISHGSLLGHAAFLKLQMDMEVTRDHLNKLHVYTIGSPRYLPKGLLADTKLLNFYHVKDKMIRLVNMLPFGGCKVPNLKKAEENMEKAFGPSSTTLPADEHQFQAYDKETDPKHHLYDKDNAIVYVNRSNFIPDVLRSEIHINHPSRYYIPTFEKDASGFFNFGLFHATHFILYPIMDYTTMWYLDAFPENNIPGFTPCSSVVATAGIGGANKKQHIKFQHKVYKIRKDKVGKYITIKKVKTYLKEIRGKYRYTTKC